MAKSKKGILYVATGQKYIEEAILSARSCRLKNTYPIAIITDSPAHLFPAGLFDYVIVKTAYYGYRDKTLIINSPFDQTLFLDTDTFVSGSLDGLFRILDYREFAIHQADEGFEYSFPELSSAMPEFNTGVIAFSLTENVKNLFLDWHQSFDQIQSVKTDQYHLRKLLYASEVKFAIFSSAFNFIIYHTNLVMQDVVILHGRPISILPKIATDVNNIRHQRGWRRVYYPHHQEYTMLYSHLKNQDIFRIMKLCLRSLTGNILRMIRLKK